MPKLTKDGDLIKLTLTGLSSDEFAEALSRVKAVPGRRWDPAEKVWVFKDDALIIQRIVQSIKPEMDAEVAEWLRSEIAKSAEAVATDLPDDADLLLPGAGVMYGYQRAGAAFLVDHPRSILADDMGLGKTIQSIAAVYEHAMRVDGTGNPAAAAGGARLVICPNSSKLNWKREIEKWVPALCGWEPEVFIIDGSKQKREKTFAQIKRSEACWVIVNWEKLRIMPELGKIAWQAVIADEAHRAKNRKSQQTKALWRLKAPMQLALTGTPIMNRPDEIWTLLKWTHPEVYTSYWRFFEQYVDYYEGYFGRVIVGVRNADHLRFELADKLARRTKAKVLDLPEKTRVFMEVEMSAKQRRLYEEVEEQFWVEVEAAAKDGDESAKALIRAANNGGSLMAIPNAAARTTRLRQVATSPALLGGEDESAKLDAALDLINDGGPDRQWVVFSNFKGSIDLLAARLDRQKPPISYAKIDGDVKIEDRQKAVEDFQAGTLRVLLCTIAAGGVALTLTAAQDCIFLERDWVPANNDQAEDRLHRIGQKNAVTIYIIETANTVDTDKISPTNERKRAIVASILEAAE